MAAAAPVRHLLDINNENRPGNRCPICQEWEAPSWRGGKVQYRQDCCGVLICDECFIDWRDERGKVIVEFMEKCGRRAYAQFEKRWSKKLRARARGEKDKEAAKSKKKKGGKKEDEKKRALEKLLERHWTCPSCRAPIGTTPEDDVKDGRQAERWFRAAMTDMGVMDGGPAAANDLGIMYANGEGVGKDVEEAKKLWTMAHEAGSFHATCSLGGLFQGSYGPAAGVPDHEKAVTLYRQADEAGYDVAQYNLGLCYDNGEGVEQDKEKAKAWYAKAAKQGHADAMHNLAKELETEGAAAVPAAMALRRALVEKGDAEAQEWVREMEEWILTQCASCGKPRADMAGAPLKCSRCKSVAYCSAACQKQHWKRGGHKKACNEREKYLPKEEE